MRLRAVGKAGMKRAEPAPASERLSRVMFLSARRTMLWRGFLYGIKAGRARFHLRTAESSDVLSARRTMLWHGFLYGIKAG